MKSNKSQLLIIIALIYLKRSSKVPFPLSTLPLHRKKIKLLSAFLLYFYYKRYTIQVIYLFSFPDRKASHRRRKCSNISCISPVSFIFRFHSLVKLRHSLNKVAEHYNNKSNNTC